MPRTILIVGGLTTECDRETVLQALLHGTTEEGVEWKWAKADHPAYRLPQDSLVNKIAYEPENRTKDVTLVVLRCLNRDDKNKLLKKRPDPILVPGTVTTGDELVTWLLDPNSGLVPPREWWATARETAFFAILAKLLKNKDWANGRQNHNFTQEAHLLGQAPVNAHAEVRSEANHLLDKMKDVLLLTKGGTQGTKKEWAIYRPRLAAVMAAFLQQSLAPLDTEPGLGSLLGYVRGGRGERLCVDEIVQVERVREVCRSERPNLE
jgi:hypothetical protein